MLTPYLRACETTQPWATVVAKFMKWKFTEFSSVEHARECLFRNNKYFWHEIIQVQNLSYKLEGIWIYIEHPIRFSVLPLISVNMLIHPSKVEGMLLLPQVEHWNAIPASIWSCPQATLFCRKCLGAFQTLTVRKWMAKPTQMNASLFQTLNVDISKVPLLLTASMVEFSCFFPWIFHNICRIPFPLHSQPIDLFKVEVKLEVSILCPRYL